MLARSTRSFAGEYLLSRRRVSYVTTPIYYPNAEPHLGHLYSSVIADVHLRFRKLTRPTEDVWFTTGTDEHGLKIQKAAERAGKEPQVFVDSLEPAFKKLCTAARLYDPYFVRTSDSDHKNAVKHLWNELDARGYIYKGQHSGWYSIIDECFYTSSQIRCVARATATRPEKLVSIETDNPVEWTDETNYKFRLSVFRERLLKHYSQNPSAIYPQERRDEILETLHNPDLVQDISVSRPSSRLKWGIPVPKDDEHTIYVWIDALTAYLTAAGYPRPSKYWPPNLQVIGKDILRFHAIYLPAILMALDLPLTERLLAHAHWTVEGRKMSKSTGNVVSPFEVIDAYRPDLVRWYLIRAGGTFRDDSDWSASQLKKHASEMVNLFGGLASRLHGIGKRFKGTVDDTSLASPPSGALYESISNLPKAVSQSMQELRFGEAAGTIISLLRDTNADFTHAKPWAASTASSTRHTSLWLARETLRVTGIVLQPVMPDKCTELLDAMNVLPHERTWDHAEVQKASQLVGMPFDRYVASGKSAPKLFEHGQTEPPQKASSQPP